MKNWVNRCFILLLALCMGLCSALAQEQQIGDGPVALSPWVMVEETDREPAAPEALPPLAELDIDASIPLDGKLLSDGQGAFPSSLTLYVGDSAKLDGKALSGGKKVKYESSDKRVATVSAYGVVKAKKPGTTTITCTQNGKKLAKCKVRVKERVINLTLNMTSADIEVGETCQLSVEPSDAEVSWSSSKPSVAQVDDNGLVTGIAKGFATISVKPKNGKKVRCKVKVTEPVINLTLDITSTEIEIGETCQLSVEPSNAEVSWSSNNPSVAQVDDNGLVTGIAKGFATIAAKPKNGKKAKCRVRVKEHVDYDDLDESLKQIDANGFVLLPQAEVLIFNKLNEFRVSKGCPALSADEELNKAARVRAFELYYNFSHYRPDGRWFNTVSPLSSHNHENLGCKAGSGYFGSDDESVASTMIHMWENTPANVNHSLNSSSTRVGVGVVVKQDEDWYHVYAVELFSKE